MTEPAVEERDAAYPKFHFVGLLTRRLAFQELSPPDSGLAPLANGVQVPVELEVQVAVQVDTAKHQSGTTLTVVVTPDATMQPYRIEVSLTALFRGPEGVPKEKHEGFAKTNVPVILWPYVREAVHRLTMDASRGPVRLDPVNLHALLGQQEWQTMPKKASEVANSEGRTEEESG